MKIFLTGVTGFLSSELIPRLLERGHEIVGVARNETKIVELKQKYPQLKIITGDICDEWTVKKGMEGAKLCLHTAAFKHVGLAEEDTFQCTETNVIGSRNILKESYNCPTLKMVVGITTDKTQRVTGMYGATKMIMEGLFREAEKVNPKAKYRTVLYGNILYSSGSVLCKWLELIKQGKEVIITDSKATRFFWTKRQAVDLIFEAMENAVDAKPYKPKGMKSMQVGQLLLAMIEKYSNIVPGKYPIKIIGLQPGENMHESLGDGIDSETAPKYTIEEIKKLI